MTRLGVALVAAAGLAACSSPPSVPPVPQAPVAVPVPPKTVALGTLDTAMVGEVVVEPTTTSTSAPTTTTVEVTTTTSTSAPKVKVTTTTTEYEAPVPMPQSKSTRGSGEGPPEYIKQCESGGNYGAVNLTSGAGGAWQFLESTWRSVGGSGRPQDASPAEQDYRASILWDGGRGRSQWDCG